MSIRTLHINGLTTYGVYYRDTLVTTYMSAELARCYIVRLVQTLRANGVDITIGG